ncbi:MAG TPA: PspC domain-containing protein [Thermoanaerobaculia bacterium]|nr:PspC domain-containing protein [Thermoanaerobaculia bacterium]
MGLYRSRTNRMLAGVCGGIARHFNLDPTLVRILYVVISLFSAAVPGVLLYVILWIIVPEEPAPTPNVGTGGGAAPPPPPVT